MEKAKDNKLAFNLIANLISYGVSFGVSFFLSPYIVRHVGVDAYGYVGLANNFVGYALLIAVALNSMEGRFITIKLYEDDIKGANRYYSSVFMANLTIGMVLSLVSVIAIVFLEKIIKISDGLVADVRILFTALFATAVINTVCSVFSVSTFATNKLYLNSKRQVESNIVKIIMLVVMFSVFTPRISYLGITTLVTSLYVALTNVYYMRKFLPELHIRKKYFDIKAIIEIVSSGVWNLVNRLGQILLDGLDLYIANIFIDPTSMGILSIVKTVPNAINGIISSVVGVFSPNFTFLYAENKMDELVASVKQSIKIMGFICNIPVIVLVVCGRLFFSLWQPTQDPSLLEALSILTCMCTVVSGGINCIYNIFTVVNKLKLNSCAVILSGFIQLSIVFILLKTTDLGLYAIAGVSSVVSIIRNIAFTAPYGAKCLNKKWYTFYPEMLKTIVFSVVCSGIGLLLCRNFKFEGWIGLIIVGGITGVISVIIGFFIILNKSDRQFLVERVMQRFKKGDSNG